ncbi:MAG: D-aminoacylase [Candidatus Hydrogenedentales bacterium]
MRKVRWTWLCALLIACTPPPAEDPGVVSPEDVAAQPAPEAAAQETNETAPEATAASTETTTAAMEEAYDIIIRNGDVYDGTGAAATRADVALKGDRIAAVGDLAGEPAKQELDASGLVVAPGFINMLSWATESLIIDGRSLGDIKQGVTLEVFGEGFSMGPLTDQMAARIEEDQGDYSFEVEWTTLGDYLEYLEGKGVSTNVASFVGATTVRAYVLGYENRAPNAEELKLMQELVRQAMEEGAMGVGSSLIYPPAFFASTEELIALCSVASEYGGMYISHMRSEGNQLLEGIDELIRIARKADVRAEIYHLKAAGQENWPKMDEAIAKIEAARAEGLPITADMYTYVAGSTGVDAMFPPWVAEGGREALEKRLTDPEQRAKILAEMRTPTDAWENLLHMAGTAANVLLVGFDNEELKKYTGKTLQEVAEERGKTPEETAIELVLEDGSRVGAVYFMMSEENVKKQMAYPWVSFGSDASSMAPEGVFVKSSTHPRAYGNVARLLGKYVRDEKVIPLEEAIRRLTSLPAGNLRLKERGEIKESYFADLAIFDPNEVQDLATFEEPHQLATGMRHVFVNGVQVLRDGEHTGALPGRVVRGPGWAGWAETGESN